MKSTLLTTGTVLIALALTGSLAAAAPAQDPGGSTAQADCLKKYRDFRKAQRLARPLRTNDMARVPTSTLAATASAPPSANNNTPCNCPNL